MSTLIVVGSLVCFHAVRVLGSCQQRAISPDLDEILRLHDDTAKTYLVQINLKQESLIWDRSSVYVRRSLIPNRDKSAPRSIG